MRSSTAGFQALLAGSQFLRCFLYTITTFAGNIYRYTDADVDVVAGGYTYISTGPSIKGAKYHLIRGLSVDILDLIVLAKPTDLINGISWSAAALTGALDGCTIKIDFALLSTWSSAAESINIFSGLVQDVKKGEADFQIAVVSDSDRLNQMVPKLMFQPGCSRSLYAADCTVLQSSYTFSGSVSVATSRTSFTTGLTQADGYFALGSILFSSGANSGVSRSVKTFTNASGVVTLSFPLAADLAPGDAFTIVAGCDKTIGSNGCAKFANTANFKGFTYLPMPDAIV